MRIDASGNIGIGDFSTLTVSTKFDVDGNAKIRGLAGSNKGLVTHQTDGTLQSVTLSSSFTNSFLGDDGIFHNIQGGLGAVYCNSSSDNFLMKKDGVSLCNSLIYDNNTNVGIGNFSGTNLPQAALHINSNLIPNGITGEVFLTQGPASLTNAWRMLTGTGATAEKASFYIPANTSDLAIHTTRNNSKILFRTFQTTRMVILDGVSSNQNGGFVGIGRKFYTPTSLLHLNDGIFSVAMQITNLATDTLAIDGLKVGIEADGTALINQQENFDMFFKTYDTERMRIFKTGEVGVGDFSSLTLTSGVKLDVNGDVSIRGLLAPSASSNLTNVVVVDPTTGVLKVNSALSTGLSGWSGAGTGDMFASSLDDRVIIGGTSSALKYGKFHVINSYISNLTPKCAGYFYTDCSSFYLTNILTGVWGKADNVSSIHNSLVIGVRGDAIGNDNQFCYGVKGNAVNAVNNYGVYGSADGGSNNYAGYFQGNTQVNGNLYVTGTYPGSDLKLKDNIQPIANALNIINQLQPKTFDFKTIDYARLNLPEGNQYGLIAQEVETILPNLIKNAHLPQEFDSLGNVTADSLSYKALNYTALVPILVQGMKELNSKNDSLKTVIASYESRFANIETILAGCCQNTGAKLLSQNNNEQNTTDVNTIFNISVDNSMNKGNTELYQNRPNPFTTTTTFTYHLGQAGMIELELYNGLGEFITKLVNTNQATGDYSIDWNTSDIAPGIYFYSLKVDGMLWVKKAVRIK